MCLGKGAMGRVGADGAERTSCENAPRGIETRRRDDPCLAALQCSDGWGLGGGGAVGMSKGKRWRGRWSWVEWKQPKGKRNNHESEPGSVRSIGNERGTSTSTYGSLVHAFHPHPHSHSRSHSSQSQYWYIWYMSALGLGSWSQTPASLSQERVRKVLVVSVCLGLPRQSGRGYNINSTPQRGRGDLLLLPSRLSFGRTLTTSPAAVASGGCSCIASSSPHPLPPAPPLPLHDDKI